jgi:RHS repeat-associated protein
LTNADGDIVQRYDYDPYGVTIASSGGFSNPYQYTGRERDQSGLYYYRARYYSSGMGRFISEDPIGLLAGINMYGYVGGSPIRFSDPYGLQTIVLPWTPTMPIPFPGTLIDPVLMPMSPADIDQSLGEYTDSSTGTKEQCPRECAGLLSQLREHQRKLQQYKSDPFSMDNNGFLINASPERQRSIIDGRIRSLERQIENFERQYWNCMIKNGAIL